MEDLNNIFRQAGLRFDDDFLNQVFFEGQNVVFRFYSSPDNTQTFSNNGKPLKKAPKPGLIDRMLMKIVTGMSKLLVRMVFGVKIPDPPPQLDEQQEISLSAAQALSGIEKKISVRHGWRKKKYLVKIPAGHKTAR